MGELKETSYMAFPNRVAGRYKDLNTKFMGFQLTVLFNLIYEKMPDY